MTLSGRATTALVVVAVISICLNLLVIGFMLGNDWRGGRHGPWGGHWGGHGMSWLPEESRAVVEQAIEENRDRFEAMRDEMQKSREEVAKVLEADTVDRAALEQALNGMEAKRDEMHQTMRQVMVDLALKLPADQRREIVRHWLESRRGMSMH